MSAVTANAFFNQQTDPYLTIHIWRQILTFSARSCPWSIRLR